MRPRSLRVLVGGALVSAVAAGLLVNASASDGGSKGRPPASDLASAEVEERPLRSVVTTRGAFTVADEQTLVAPPKPESASILAVTATPIAVGEEAPAASVVMEFNGRPLFVVQADVPIYQAIRPGARGPEVAALQQGLAGAGRLDVGDEAGSFGPRTQAAVGQLYRDAGYEPPYGAGSQAAYEQGVEDKTAKADAARAAANAARAQGQIDPAAEAGYQQALADRRTFIESQGVMVTPDELVALPKLPLTVLRLEARRGEAIEPGAPALVLGSPAAALEVGISAAQLSQLGGAAEVEVQVESEDGSYRGSCAYAKPTRTSPDAADTADVATTSAVGGGDAPAPDDPDPAGMPADYTFRALCDPVPPAALDAVGATVSLEATVAAEGLVVPSTAVEVDGAGNSSVMLVDGAQDRRVAVEVLADAGGFTAIEAASGRLRPGDRVRVRDR